MSRTFYVWYFTTWNGGHMKWGPFQLFWKSVNCPFSELNISTRGPTQHNLILWQAKLACPEPISIIKFGSTSYGFPVETAKVVEFCLFFYMNVCIWWMYRKTDNFSLITAYHKPISLLSLNTVVCIYFNVFNVRLKGREQNVLIYGGLFFPLHECMKSETCILPCSRRNNPC